MKKLAPSIGGALIAAFALAVAGVVVSLSFQALGRIFPNSLADQAIGLVLFDVSAFVWFIGFVYLCHSTTQYVWSLFGFLIGLGGTIALVGIEVGISSGMLVAANMIKPLTYTFIGVAVAHLVLLYLRHGSAPEVSARISLGIEKAKITDEGMRQTEQQLEAMRANLGSTIQTRLVNDVLRDMNMTPIPASTIPGLFPPTPPEAGPQQPPDGMQPREAATGFFDNLKQRIRNPFTPREGGFKSTSQAKHGENNQAAWTINPATGEARRIFCLMCRDTGRDWLGPEICDHIDIHQGKPVEIETIPQAWPDPNQSADPTYHPEGVQQPSTWPPSDPAMRDEAVG